MTGVRIVGTATSPFVARTGGPIHNVGATTAVAALSDADMGPSEIDLVIMGSRFEHPSMGQRIMHLIGTNGQTIINTENACASGSVAVEIACAYLTSGLASGVLIIGVEAPSQLPAGAIPLPDWDLLGSVGVSHPVRYALDASEYCSRHDIDPQLIAHVSVKNRRHGSLNPLARFQSPVTVDEVLASGVIADPLTKLQCCANADGSSALVLVADDHRAARSPRSVRLRAIATGSGVSSDRKPEKSLTTRLAHRAYEQAGLGPHDIDVAEVYDAFSIVEIMNSEYLGFCESGQAARRIAEGGFALGNGALVTNAGGGLLGRGHPLGATGVAQFGEIITQLRGESGQRQVDGARIGLVHTLGGNFREIESNAGVVAVLDIQGHQ